MATNASLYLAAVLDWFTRRVLSWRVSITLEADFCIEAVEQALARHGTPEIFNMEHGRAIGSSGHATSGQPVHVDRVHQGAGGPGDQDQHGRKKGPGGITSSSSGSGGPSNTRRSTCGPMPACPRPAPRSGATSASTTPAAHIHRLTAKPQIRLTSTRCCRFRWQHNQGGNPLKKRPEPVQTNRATSVFAASQRAVGAGNLHHNPRLICRSLMRRRPNSSIKGVY